MKHVKDERMDDLFLIPQPARPVDGSADYSFQVSNLVSHMLKDTDLDRYEISAQMSRLTGKDISKNMIDAWASPGRTDHNLPFYLVAVLESVCTSHDLTNWLAEKGGGRVAYGRETLKAKLATTLMRKQRAEAEYRALAKMLGEGDEE